MQSDRSYIFHKQFKIPNNQPLLAYEIFRLWQKIVPAFPLFTEGFRREKANRRALLELCKVFRYRLSRVIYNYHTENTKEQTEQSVPSPRKNFTLKDKSRYGE